MGREIMIEKQKELVGMLKKLVNKDVIIKAVEDKKSMAESNAFAHFGNYKGELTETGQAEWEGLVNGWNDALYYVIKMLKNED
jgi:hypothetical protein